LQFYVSLNLEAEEKKWLALDRTIDIKTHSYLYPFFVQRREMLHHLITTKVERKQHLRRISFCLLLLFSSPTNVTSRVREKVIVVPLGWII
jgi:hypothetical protein